MAVIVNKNTQQSAVVSGRTGTQVIKFIDAPRVYVKTKDSSPTPVATISDGTTPSGWTDLGIVEGKVRIQYDKELNEIRTGIDNVLVASYVKQRTASFEFTLSQFDDVVLEQLSGITPSVIQSGSIVQFSVGAEDVIEKALLLVVQNKLDGKEWQFYHPAAQISFTIGESGEATVVNGRGNLPIFTYATKSIVMTTTMFAKA